MEMVGRSYRIWLYGVLLLSTLCESKVLELSLDTNKALQNLSPYFLSITLDPIILVDQATGGRQIKDGFDSVRAMNMARGLSPAFLRLGGPSTDEGVIRFQAYTDDEAEHGDSLLNGPEKETGYLKPSVTVNGAQLTLLNHFAEDSGLKLIVSLGYDHDRQRNKARKRAEGLMDYYDNEYDMDSWDTKQALDIIRFANSKNMDLGYQLGYEAYYLNGSKVDLSKDNKLSYFLGESGEDESSNYDAEIDKREAENAGLGLGLDLIRLRNLIDAYPHSRGAQLFSPGICLPSAVLRSDDHSQGGQHLQSFLQAFIGRADDALNAVVLHPYEYRVQSYRKEKGKKNKPDTMSLGTDGIIKVLGHSMGSKPICIGESWKKKLENGAPKVSEFEEALEWAQHLGRSARMGANIILHSPKADALQNPDPQYWVSLLHKKLAGAVVLETRPSADNSIESDFYAHCTPHSIDSYPMLFDSFPRGSVTLYAVNPSTESTQAILRGLSEHESLFPDYTDDGGMAQVIYEYVLTEYVPEGSSGNNSRGSLLNGKLLEINENGELPYLAPNEIKIDIDDTKSGAGVKSDANTVRNKISSDKSRRKRKIMENGNKESPAGKQKEILLQLPAKSVAFWVLPPSTGVKPCLRKEGRLEWKDFIPEARTNKINVRGSDQHHKTKEMNGKSSTDKGKNGVVMRKDIKNPVEVHACSVMYRKRRDLPPLTFPKSPLEIPTPGILAPRPTLFQRLKGLLGRRSKLGLNSAELDLLRLKTRLKNQRTKIPHLPKVISFGVEEETEEPPHGDAYEKGIAYLSEEKPSQSKEDYGEYGDADYDFMEDDFNEQDGVVELPEEVEESVAISSKVRRESVEADESKYSGTPNWDENVGVSGGYLGNADEFTSPFGSQEKGDDHQGPNRELFEAELSGVEADKEEEGQVILVDELLRDEEKLPEPSVEAERNSGEEGEDFERDLVMEDDKVVEAAYSGDELEGKVSEAASDEELTNINQGMEGNDPDEIDIGPSGIITDTSRSIEIQNGDNPLEEVYNDELIEGEAFSDPTTKDDIKADEVQDRSKQQDENILKVHQEEVKEEVNMNTSGKKVTKLEKKDQLEDVISYTQPSILAQIFGYLNEIQPTTSRPIDSVDNENVTHAETGTANEETKKLEIDMQPKSETVDDQAYEEIFSQIPAGNFDSELSLIITKKNVSPKIAKRRKREVNVEENASSTTSTIMEAKEGFSDLKGENIEVKIPKVLRTARDKFSEADEKVTVNDGTLDNTQKNTEESGAKGNKSTKLSLPDDSHKPSAPAETLTGNSFSDSLDSPGKSAQFDLEKSNSQSKTTMESLGSEQNKKTSPATTYIDDDRSVFEIIKQVVHGSDEEVLRLSRSSAEDIRTPAEKARRLNFPERTIFNLDPRSQQLQSTNENETLSTTTEMTTNATAAPLSNHDSARERAREFVKTIPRPRRPVNPLGLTIPTVPTLPMIPALPTIPTLPSLHARPRANIPTLPPPGTRHILRTRPPQPELPPISMNFTRPTLPPITPRPRMSATYTRPPPTNSPRLQSRPPQPELPPISMNFTRPTLPPITPRPRMSATYTRPPPTNWPHLQLRPPRPTLPTFPRPTRPTLPQIPRISENSTRSPPIIWPHLQARAPRPTLARPTMPTLPPRPRMSEKHSRPTKLPVTPARLRAHTLRPSLLVRSHSQTTDAPATTTTTTPATTTTTTTPMPEVDHDGKSHILTRKSIEVDQAVSALPAGHRSTALEIAAREQNRQVKRQLEADRRKLVLNAAAESRRKALEALSRRPARDVGVPGSTEIRGRAEAVMQQLSDNLASPIMKFWDDMRSRITHLREELREKRDLIRKRRSIESVPQNKWLEDEKSKVIAAMGKTSFRKNDEGGEKKPEEFSVKDKVKKYIFGMKNSDHPRAQYHEVASKVEDLLRRRRHLVQSHSLFQTSHFREKRDNIWGTSASEDWPVDNEFIYYPSDGSDEYTEIRIGNEKMDGEGPSDFWSEPDQVSESDSSDFAIDTARRGLYPIGPYSVMNHLYAQGELYKLAGTMNEPREHDSSHRDGSLENKSAGQERSNDSEDVKYEKHKGDATANKGEKTSDDESKSNESKEKSKEHGMKISEKKTTNGRKRRWTVNLKESDLRNRNELGWSIESNPSTYDIDLIQKKQGILSNKVMRYGAERGDGGGVFLVALKPEKKGEDESRVDSDLTESEKEHRNKEDASITNSTRRKIRDGESRVQKIPLKPKNDEKEDRRKTEKASEGSTTVISGVEAMDIANSFMSYVMNNMTELVNFFRSMMGWSQGT